MAAAGGGHPHPGGAAAGGPGDIRAGKLEESTVLVAETPYDGLYDLYVQAQIHYADGDMAHWNNAMALWNRGVEALQAETLRKMGEMQTANCLRLC